MAQKNATPSKAQQAVMRANVLNPLVWTVVKDLDRSMIVRNMITGEFRLIDK